MHHVHLIGAKAVLLDLVVALNSEKSRRSVAGIYRHLDSYLVQHEPTALGAEALLTATNYALFSILNDPTMPLVPCERSRIVSVRGEIAESIGAIRDQSPHTRAA